MSEVRTCCMQIIDVYGAKHQKQKAIEELNELIDAIKSEDVENIAEEVADVSIMLTQLSMIYDLTKDYINTLINYKVKRTLFRARLEND